MIKVNWERQPDPEMTLEQAMKGKHRWYRIVHRTTKHTLLLFIDINGNTVGFPDYGLLINRNETWADYKFYALDNPDITISVVEK